MAETYSLTGWPKGVIGNNARDTTNRPPKLRLKATAFTGWPGVTGSTSSSSGSNSTRRSTSNG